MSEQKVIVTITGPSLTGKTTLAQELMAYNSQFQPVVTHTTRAIRQGEINGESYHFVSKEEFMSTRDQNGFIEFTEVGPPGNTNFYGASKAAVEKVLQNGKSPLLVIEPEGAANVYKFCVENNFKVYQVFLNNPQDVLIHRFFERFRHDKLATPENYAKRLKNMLEVEPSKWINPALDGTHRYDYVCPKFDENKDEVVKHINLKVQELIKNLEPLNHIERLKFR